jgi:hypothetical protein
MEDTMTRTLAPFDEEEAVERVLVGASADFRTGYLFGRMDGKLDSLIAMLERHEASP